MQSELYDALREAGVSEEKARAAAVAAPPQGELVTKTDLVELELRLQRFILNALGVAVGLLAAVFTVLMYLFD